MRAPADTSPEADAAQVEVYRRMGGTARAEVMFRLTRMGQKRRRSRTRDART
jgi:hypothetical protein